MTYVRDDFETLPRLPSWVTSSRLETPEDVTFMSGAALAHLHLVIANEKVPQTLLWQRLALRAAERCVTFTGRPERVGELRDAVAFLQPGDRSGPAGQVLLSWRRAVERAVSVGALARALPEVEADEVAVWLDAGQRLPVTQAAAVFEAVERDRPRDHSAALVLAEASLAQALGWAHIVPLLTLGLLRGDLGKSGDDLCVTFHRAVVAAVADVTREAAVLMRRAARLKAVAPKLRAKGAGEAVEMFLTRDAVTPSALASLNSDRAARRFCDRLVDLGVVRELTGRDTFRLYGI